MLIFTPTKRIFQDNQIFSHFSHFEAQLVGNIIWKKIEILSNEFWAISICIYESTLLVASLSTTPRTQSPPQTEKVWFHKVVLCYWKAIAVEISIVTMYDTVHNFVWVMRQPFKPYTLISWRLFVMTTQRNIDFLMHNTMGRIDFF